MRVRRVYIDMRLVRSLSTATPGALPAYSLPAASGSV